MLALVAWLPLLFRGIGILSAIAGLFQGQQVLSGGYSASPWNLGAVAAWLSTAAGSWFLSFVTQPVSWETIKIWLDKVFAYVKAKAGVDPQNQTDLDERAMALLEEYLLKLLAVLIARWSTASSEKGQQLLTDLKLCRLVSQSGLPTSETVTALASAAPPKA